ncbi:hypothetical protein B0J18DRAFT_261321 [Chaetomium sp. MPI-SDFR-AT-0129]|nr:hypothetical protein B0J18DRAFT_261321 [Chaetomium sp. MPI-SDFR-AT-0129]
MAQTEPLDGRDLVLEEYWRNEIDKSYAEARDRHLSTIDKWISNTQTAVSRISTDIKARETVHLSNRLHQYTLLTREGLVEKLVQDSLEHCIKKYGVDLAVSRREPEVERGSAPPQVNIRRIDQDEVEGTDFIFRYPDFGPGYFVVRCDRREAIHRFERDPFLRATGPHQRGLSQLVSHFNLVSLKCHPREEARLFSADEIVKKFGYRVVDHDGDDVDTDWVEHSNYRLASNGANSNNNNRTNTNTGTNTSSRTNTNNNTNTSNNNTASSSRSTTRLRTQQRNKSTAAAATTASTSTSPRATRKRKASVPAAPSPAPRRVHLAPSPSLGSGSPISVSSRSPTPDGAADTAGHVKPPPPPTAAAAAVPTTSATFAPVPTPTPPRVPTSTTSAPAVPTTAPDMTHNTTTTTTPAPLNMTHINPAAAVPAPVAVSPSTSTSSYTPSLRRTAAIPFAYMGSPDPMDTDI